MSVFCPSPSSGDRAQGVPLSILFVCHTELTEFFAELTEFAAELSECSLFQSSTLETVFRPFPKMGLKELHQANISTTYLIHLRAYRRNRDVHKISVHKIWAPRPPLPGQGSNAEKLWTFSRKILKIPLSLPPGWGV